MLDDTKADQFVKVTLSAASMPADGVSRALVSIDIAADTDLDKRSMSLSTTLGNFITQGKAQPTATLNADAVGHAAIELQSDIVPGRASLTIIVGQITRSVHVDLLALDPRSAFTVTVETFTLPADGFARSHIDVRLGVVGTTAQRQVKFDTTGGLILAPGQNPQTSQTVTADATGLASVDLQAARTSGSAQLTITALGVSQIFRLTFLPPSVGDIITLTADPSTAVADGLSAIKLTARINPNIDPQKKTVGFTTSAPQQLTLSSPSVDATGTNQAIAFLTSGHAGSFLANATVDGTLVSVPVTFTPALPDLVVVTADNDQLVSGGNTTIRVTLLRSNGTTPVSDLVLTYTAVKMTGGPIGHFSQAGVSNGKTATATFNVDMTTYTGAVTITAVAQGGASGMTMIVIK